MIFETIETESGFARLTLNCPDKLNRFITQMHEEVRFALDSVYKDDAMQNYYYPLVCQLTSLEIRKPVFRGN